ncbi:MAG: aldo/keto reductase [Bryobacterales bacterium]|nr:aldo/keto reductase [Bryobacterales bacterium]
MLSGKASTEGTERFAARFPQAVSHGFVRQAMGWYVSSIGLGSYLGELNDEADVGYYGATLDALAGGINVFDTAINYRHQRSEKAVGSAIRKAVADGSVSRDEVVVCTKAGFLTPGAVSEGILQECDIVRGVHSMHPGFLQDQVQRSRENLGLDAIDVHYLHNPETQLGPLDESDFDARIRLAFEALESCCEKGWLQVYGTATWDGYRRRAGAEPGLQLARLVEIAREVAGEAHHFRVVQLPFNLAMTEAFTERNQSLDGQLATLLQAAQALGIAVVASASILQARLARNLPEQMKTAFPEAVTDAQRALQFARSAPGVSTALVGMSQRAHVAENLGLSGFAPMPGELFQRLF